jgi:hypothetical protein
VSRIISYNMSVKGESPKEQLEEAKEGVVESLEGVKGDVVKAVKSS